MNIIYKIFPQLPLPIIWDMSFAVTIIIVNQFYITNLLYKSTTTVPSASIEKTMLFPYKQHIRRRKWYMAQLYASDKRIWLVSNHLPDVKLYFFTSYALALVCPRLEFISNLNNRLNYIPIESIFFLLVSQQIVALPTRFFRCACYPAVVTGTQVLQL